MKYNQDDLIECGEFHLHKGVFKVDIIKNGVFIDSMPSMRGALAFVEINRILKDGISEIFKTEPNIRELALIESGVIV